MSDGLVSAQTQRQTKSSRASDNYDPVSVKAPKDGRTKPVSDPQRGLSSRVTGKTQHRVALVIGNGNYNVSPLKNPVNDARSVAEVLRKFGFDVIEGINLTKRDMKEEVEKFSLKMKQNGVGLFYYAGHGVQLKGLNYLIPIDAEINKELDIEFESVEVDYVLRQMESAKNFINIVILDACRNNPFPSSVRSAQSGLAQIRGPIGSIVAYSAGPGEVARDGNGNHGIYTGELLKFMQMPKYSISQIFNLTRSAVIEQTKRDQIPWEHTSLQDDFYFAASGSPAIADSSHSQSQINTQIQPNNSQPVQQSSSDVNQYELDNSAKSARGSTLQITQEKTVELMANRDWISTGIDVSKNDKVQIRAFGNVILEKHGSSTPNGLTSDDPDKPMADCRTGALIARIGNKLSCVSQSSLFTVDDDGQLMLTLNVASRRKNSGVLNVSITSYRSVRN